jgi:hypothetical protein
VRIYDNVDEDFILTGAAEHDIADLRRDKIAQKMWDDYVRLCEERELIGTVHWSPTWKRMTRMMIPLAVRNRMRTTLLVTFEQTRRNTKRNTNTNTEVTTNDMYIQEIYKCPIHCLTTACRSSSSFRARYISASLT